MDYGDKLLTQPAKPVHFYAATWPVFTPPLTDRQAWRLNTTPEVILEAIRERAWLVEQIEGVSSKYRLEDHPPPLEGVPDWIDRAIDKKVKAA